MQESSRSDPYDTIHKPLGLLRILKMSSVNEEYLEILPGIILSQSTVTNNCITKNERF